MYLNYCRGLRFEEPPDYMYLRQLFRILFKTLNHQYDFVFDWTLLKQKQQQDMQPHRKSVQNTSTQQAHMQSSQQLNPTTSGETDKRKEEENRKSKLLSGMRGEYQQQFSTGAAVGDSDKRKEDDNKKAKGGLTNWRTSEYHQQQQAYISNDSDKRKEDDGRKSKGFSLRGMSSDSNTFCYS